VVCRRCRRTVPVDATLVCCRISVLGVFNLRDFDVFQPTLMKIFFFRDMLSCHHLQGCPVFLDGPEDGGSMLLRSARCFIPEDVDFEFIRK
jgi:hypothetical protein